MRIHQTLENFKIKVFFFKQKDEVLFLVYEVLTVQTGPHQLNYGLLSFNGHAALLKNILVYSKNSI
jgi:hypothetical protein